MKDLALNQKADRFLMTLTTLYLIGLGQRVFLKRGIPGEEYDPVDSPDSPGMAPTPALLPFRSHYADGRDKPLPKSLTLTHSLTRVELTRTCHTSHSHSHTCHALTRSHAHVAN